MGFLKTLFGGNSGNGTPPSRKNKSIGYVLLDQYKPFITNKKSAMKAALSVLWHGKTQFIGGPGGKIIRASDSNIALPARLQLFSDRFYDEEGGVVSREVVDLTYSITRTIQDETVQIETIYSIAEAIVEKYDL